MEKVFIMTKQIEAQFKIYHEANPHVFESFKKFATEVKNMGKEQYSANSIFERMRWHTEIETVGERFKLSNNYRAYYARKLMDEYPEFYGFFRIKQLDN